MCETLPPFGECGLGTCVNGSCVCFEGFSQNVEFFYAELPVNTITFCDYHAEAMVVIASVTLALTVLSVALNLFVLDNLKQLKRLLPLLVSYICLGITLVMRLVRVEESLFGFDVLYSFLLTISLACLILQQVIYLNKFVLYAVNVFRFKKETRQLAQFIVKLQYFLVGLVGVAVLLFSATSLVDSQEVSYQLVQTTLVLSCIVHVSFGFTCYTLFSKYISDLRSIAENSSKWESAFIRKCKRSIPRMQFVRTSTIAGNAFAVLFNLLALLLPGWLKLFVLAIYINYVVFQLATLFVLRAAGKLRCFGGPPKGTRETIAPTRSVITFEQSVGTEEATSML